MNSKDFIKIDMSIYQNLIDRINEASELYRQQLEHFSKVYNLKEEQVTGNTSIRSINADFYIFDDKNGDYEFTTFSKLAFGKSVAINEEGCLKVLDYQFYYCKFVECRFSNIIFENCSFIGCEFNKCYTDGLGIIFNNCIFSKPEFKGDGAVELENVVNISVVFKDITGFCMKARNCIMYSMISINSSFMLTEFQNTDLSDSIFYQCPYLSIVLKECNFNDSKIVRPEYIDLNIEDNIKHTKVNEGTYLSNIQYKLKKEDLKKDDYIRETKERNKTLYKTYCQLAEQFKINNIIESYGEYFYISKRTKHKIIENKYEKFVSILSLITCGYGERPYYSLISSLFIVIISAILYMFSGVKLSNGQVINYDITGTPVAIPIIVNDLIKCIHFSLVTFTTVGYGNVIPHGIGLLVSSFEMILGVIMIAIWTSTLVRKMTR